MLSKETHTLDPRPSHVTIYWLLSRLRALSRETCPQGGNRKGRVPSVPWADAEAVNLRGGLPEMEKKETSILCDLCKLSPFPAKIRCDEHGLDLCILHMRIHFDAGKCRLVPVAEEQDALTRT